MLSMQLGVVPQTQPSLLNQSLDATKQTQATLFRIPDGWKDRIQPQIRLVVGTYYVLEVYGPAAPSLLSKFHDP